MKGGVGKTTLSINTSLYLGELKAKRVLLIDLDPQANATIVGTEEAKLIVHKKTKKTIADLFINCMRSYGPFEKPKPSDIDVDEYLYRAYESADKQAFVDIIPSEIILSSVLRGVNLGPYTLDRLLVEKVQDRYDYIIIDCAPTYSILTTLALNATKSVLIPVMSDPFGVYGVELMEHVLEEHKHDYGVDVKVAGLVFTMWNAAHRHQLEFSTNIIKKWGSKYTFKTKITNNAWYKVANGQRGEIWNTAAHSNVKDEFEEFVEEFISRL